MILTRYGGLFFGHFNLREICYYSLKVKGWLDWFGCIYLNLCSPSDTSSKSNDSFSIFSHGLCHDKVDYRSLTDRILAEKQAREELAIANQRIRNYALRAEEVATLQERNRIAREIHDSLGHSLTALNLHLEIALKLSQIQPERSTELLKEAKRLGSIALQDVRQSVSTLRSDPLHGQDLPIAIQKLVDEFQLSNQLKPTCQLDLPSSLSPDIATAIYRIVQEGLTNISKYAQASEVEIAIVSSAMAIELRISDNGSGFTPSHNTTGFGLQGMRERVLSLRGTFEIVSAVDRGCRIVAIIPFIRE